MAKRTVTNNTNQSISPKELSVNLTEGKRVAASNEELNGWLLSVKIKKITKEERNKISLFWRTLIRLLNSTYSINKLLYMIS